MKIAFIINSHETEQVKYTTPTIGYAAYKRGLVFYIGVGELGYASDGNLIAMGKTITDRKFKSQETYFKAVQEQELQQVSSEDLDVLFLRNDPSDEIGEREWRERPSFIFG